jgi:putative addiction module component (TIGR02574 family)
MPMTLDEIVEETRNWPPERVGELVGRLTEDLHTSDPEIEAAWKTEIDRRIEEIQSGKVKGIPVEEVSARIQKMLGRAAIDQETP